MLLFEKSISWRGIRGMLNEPCLLKNFLTVCFFIKTKFIKFPFTLKIKLSRFFMHFFSACYLIWKINFLKIQYVDHHYYLLLLFITSLIISGQKGLSSLLLMEKLMYRSFLKQSCSIFNEVFSPIVLTKKFKKLFAFRFVCTPWMISLYHIFL